MLQQLERVVRVALEVVRGGRRAACLAALLLLVVVVVVVVVVLDGAGHAGVLDEMYRLMEHRRRRCGAASPRNAFCAHGCNTHSCQCCADREGANGCTVGRETSIECGGCLCIRTPRARAQRNPHRRLPTHVPTSLKTPRGSTSLHKRVRPWRTWLGGARGRAGHGYAKLPRVPNALAQMAIARRAASAQCAGSGEAGRAPKGGRPSWWASLPDGGVQAPQGKISLVCGARSRAVETSISPQTCCLACGHALSVWNALLYHGRA